MNQDGKMVTNRPFRPTTPLSRTSSGKPNHKAENLADGDLKNAWQPTENDKEMWIEVDLGE